MAGGGRGPAPASKPSVAWHPHRDVLAALSESGAVSVHALGGAMASGTTHHLHVDQCLGMPLCISWQPNEVRGSLAVGLSSGIALWRCSRSEGWWRQWAMYGDAFACPAVAWSPDGRCLATVGAFGVVRVWPHSGMIAEQDAPWTITLRRWLRSGTVGGLQWAPDGGHLAVLHAGSQPCVRLWSTRSWEVVQQVNLDCGSPRSQCTGGVAWCSNDVFLGVAGGLIFEFGENPGCTGGRRASFGINGFGGPYARVLPVPALAPAGGDSAAAASFEAQRQQAVLEVAVCPRTGQRVAALVEDASGVAHVLLFERAGLLGNTATGAFGGGGVWGRREICFKGLITASCTHGGNEPGARGAALPRPVALAFASGRTPTGAADARAPGANIGAAFDKCCWPGPGADGSGGASTTGASGAGITYEGSLLAVYWRFGGEDRAEVRTYPMHFLPHNLVESDASLLFD